MQLWLPHYLTTLSARDRALVARVLADRLRVRFAQRARVGTSRYLSDRVRSALGDGSIAIAAVHKAPAEYTVAIPRWLEHVVEHDVTDDDDYSNQNLESKPKISRITALILGRSIVAVFAVILEEFDAGRLKGRNAKRLRQEIQSAVNETLDNLGAAAGPA